MDLTSDGKNIFTAPYRELKKAQTLRRENSANSHTETNEVALRGGGSTDAGKETTYRHTGAAAAAGAAGKGLGKMGGGFAKGMLLDLPVAMADGFHAMPMLYGDKKMDRGAITDWKSGMAVGGKVRKEYSDFIEGRTAANFRVKSLAVGFFDGFTGIVTAPAKGAVNDGAAGFAKGFVTGTLGVLFKPGAGKFLPSLRGRHGSLLTGLAR